MVVEAIIKLFFGFFDFILSYLPTIDVPISYDFINSLSEIMAVTSYFIPVDYIVSLTMASLAIDGSGLIWRILMRIKSMIPTMGN